MILSTGERHDMAKRRSSSEYWRETRTESAFDALTTNRLWMHCCNFAYNHFVAGTPFVQQVVASVMRYGGQSDMRFSIVRDRQMLLVRSQNSPRERCVANSAEAFATTNRSMFTAKPFDRSDRRLMVRAASPLIAGDGKVGELCFKLPINKHPNSNCR